MDPTDTDPQHWPELNVTSPYVRSRVDSNTFTMGNSMPESTLTLCQSWLYPPVRSGTLDVASVGMLILNLCGGAGSVLRCVAGKGTHAARCQRFWAERCQYIYLQTGTRNIMLCIHRVFEDGSYRHGFGPSCCTPDLDSALAWTRSGSDKNQVVGYGKGTTIHNRAKTKLNQ